MSEPEAEKSEVVALLKCEECGYGFDGADPRATNYKALPTLCPLCSTFRYRGSEAWAIHNDCQGVFTCGIRHTKAEAMELIPSYRGAADRVVPVRIYVDPDDFYREAQEAQR